MQKLRLLLMITVGGGLVMAQPWGAMRAEPNPCRVEPGQQECTSFIKWETRGVERAKVFVTAEGRYRQVEHEFSKEAECHGDNCSAPWIKPGTTFHFQLYDFTRGDRGRLLASVSVTAEEGHGHRDDAGAWGRIEAEPNPCRIRRGEKDCVSFINWETRGVERAKVIVIAEGRHTDKEREFGSSLSCDTRRCRAPWIAPDTRYTFQLIDFSHGDRGRVLASVTVTGRD